MAHKLQCSRKDEKKTQIHTETKVLKKWRARHMNWSSWRIREIHTQLHILIVLTHFFFLSNEERMLLFSSNSVRNSIRMKNCVREREREQKRVLKLIIQIIDVICAGCRRGKDKSKQFSQPPTSNWCILGWMYVSKRKHCVWKKKYT